MLRSRVLSSIDTERLANAVSRPGIDPRIWVSYAVLTSEPYVETIEGEEDVIANIMLLPSGMQETARVGAIYAGNGFGLYAPLHIDDEVLVVAPSGDPDEGMVITQRLWSPADKPPAELAENTEDVLLVVETDKNLRIKTLGAGNVILAVDTGKVFLGAETGTEPAAKGQTLKDYLDAIASVFNSHVHVSAAPGTPTGPPIAPPPVPLPDPYIPAGVGFPVPPPTILADSVEVK